MRAPIQARQGSRLLAVAVAALLAVAAAGAAEGLDALRQRRQETRLQLAAEKARVLREDSDAVALRQQIERLYRELDHLVSAKPSVARIQADLDRLEETLRTQEAADPKTARPTGKSTP